MALNNIPFELDKGILFEDSNNLLKWGIELNSIKQIDNPIVKEPTPIIKWENKSCFGGQILDVLIIVNNHQNTNGVLEFIEFEEKGVSAREFYKKYSNFFNLSLGPPSQFKKGMYDTPTSLWNLNNLQIIIGIGERYVEYQIFGIHYGEEFWRLKE